MPLHQLIFLTMLVTACGYAAVRGGAPERIAAGAQFGAVISTWLCATLALAYGEPYGAVEFGVAATDFTLFVVMGAIALTSTRFWPMLQTSMLGCGLLSHIAEPLGPDILPKAYYATVAIWGYPTVILLVVATWRHQVRLKRYGVDYPWVRSLPRRYRNGWSVNELARLLSQR